MFKSGDILIAETLLFNTKKQKHVYAFYITRAVEDSNEKNNPNTRLLRVRSIIDSDNVCAYAEWRFTKVSQVSKCLEYLVKKVIC